MNAEGGMQNFIAQLRDIRSNLRQSLRVADTFQQKLVGPRPDQAGNENKQAMESVASILGEIGGLSLVIRQTLERQHEIIGDFTPDQVEAANPARYA